MYEYPDEVESRDYDERRSEYLEMLDSEGLLEEDEDEE